MVRKTVAVVYGGASPEAEISRKSASAVISALSRMGVKVFGFELDRFLPLKLFETSPEIVFPVVHGAPGEDGTLQGLLEIMGIPYVGEDVRVSALCMDKDLTKRVLLSFGISVPNWITVSKENIEEVKGWADFPAVVKPVSGGSSVGLFVVSDGKGLLSAVKSLLKETERVMVERFIPGREFTCGFLTGEVLPPLEIKPKKGIYDFESKYVKGKTEFVPLGGELKERVWNLTLKVCKALGIEQLARVDFRYNPAEDKLYLLEINTIPGMTETSLLPKMANLAGYSFEDILEKLISSF
jgi:D-alanine-D-alanine ligase